MTNFEAELEQELTEENILSECDICQGRGIVMESTPWGEVATECECLKKYRDNF